MNTRGPVKIKAICWAECVVVKNVGRHNEEEITERSHETFLLTATSPADLMAQLEDAIKAHPAPALKNR